MDKVCVVLGGGGHAHVLLDCLRSAAGVRVCAILDSDSRRWGTNSCGVPIRGGDDMLPDMAAAGANCFVVGLGGIGDNKPRQRLFELALMHGLVPLTVKHPTAVCSPWATIGEGCQLLPGSILNAGAELGENVIVNTGAIVEHDCRIGRHVHVASGATLGGNVRVGDRAHIGAGAVVRQSLAIGEDAVVGAAAVVVRDVACGVTVVGVPARPLVR